MLGPEAIFRRVEAAFKLERAVFLAKTQRRIEFRAARAACILLLADDGFSQVEIAKILGRDPSTINQTQARRYGSALVRPDVRAAFICAVEAP